MAEAAPALALEGIAKSFDGHAALKGARFGVGWGEVHALLGENGAGKSTLMNIVCGIYSADQGSVWLSGRPAAIEGPRDAARLGIGMVHQHFKLVGPFSVAENVLLACGRFLGVASVEAAARAVEEAAARLGFAIDPRARVAGLSVAERQKVEILKLILIGAEILILDEPTSVLTDAEAEGVLSLLRDMAAQGKAVVLITHRLREVTQSADRVTIMRDGETVLDGGQAAALDEAALARFMVGETLADATAPGARAVHHTVRLEVDDLTVTRADGAAAVAGAALRVRAGEILGIAGVGGNGQTELAEAIYGLQEPSGGAIRVDGRPVTGRSVRERRRRGLRLVPADRNDFALLADFRAYENLALTDVPDGRFGPWWWLRRGCMRQHAERVFAQRQIIGGRPGTRTRLFSGGNAQKLLLARELAEGTAVLIAHSPTRGLDVRACQAVHHSIVAAAEKGAACLLISEDLDEILQLSTSVAVMSRGRILGPYAAGSIGRARIGELMAGHA